MDKIYKVVSQSTLPKKIYDSGFRLNIYVLMLNMYQIIFD